MREVWTGHSDVNGTRLYHEVRGRGPSVLFVSGATGDAGHWVAVADALADAFTVVTYDRRGNSRSPRPAGASGTSIEEQADDAAALVAALGVGPAAVVGTSGGAIIACCMLLRRPEAVRAAVLHEPPLAAVLPDVGDGAAALRAMIAEAMARGGPPEAVRVFVRDAAGPAFDAIPAETLARMAGNGETLFGAELDAFLSYRPDADALAAAKAPVRILLGEDTTPFFRGTTAWLAERLRVDVGTLPGGHTPYFDRPAATAAALRAILRELA